MSVPKIDWSCPEERRNWKEQNTETLRRWAALSLTEKIKIIEEMEQVARSIHGGKLPPFARRARRANDVVAATSQLPLNSSTFLGASLAPKKIIGSKVCLRVPNLNLTRSSARRVETGRSKNIRASLPAASNQRKTRPIGDRPSRILKGSNSAARSLRVKSVGLSPQIFFKARSAAALCEVGRDKSGRRLS